MGDRCHLEITVRRHDLPRFAPFVGAEPGDQWWDYADDEPGANPDVATVHVYEANYAWFRERHEAARAGLVFAGTHSEGGTYGSRAFAALDGEMLEAELTHEGFLAVAVDDDLKPVGDPGALRGYAAKARAVRALFAEPGPASAKRRE